MAKSLGILGRALVCGGLSAGFGLALAQDVETPPAAPTVEQPVTVTCPATAKSVTGAVVGGGLANLIDRTAGKKIDGLGSVIGRIVDARIKGPETPVKCTSLPPDSRKTDGAASPAPVASAPKSLQP